VARLARDPEVEALIDAYRADLIAAGHFAEKEVTSPARAFLLRVGGSAGWSQLPLEQQRQLANHESSLVMWMIAAGHVRPSPEFLARGYQRIGAVSAWVHREFHERFMARRTDRVLAEGGRAAVVGGREGRRGRWRATRPAHPNQARDRQTAARRRDRQGRSAVGQDHADRQALRR
jgi:hypothetical protein